MLVCSPAMLISVIGLFLPYMVMRVTVTVFLPYWGVLWWHVDSFLYFVFLVGECTSTMVDVVNMGYMWYRHWFFVFQRCAYRFTNLGYWSTRIFLHFPNPNMCVFALIHTYMKSVFVFVICKYPLSQCFKTSNVQRKNRFMWNILTRTWNIPSARVVIHFYFIFHQFNYGKNKFWTRAIPCLVGW